MTEDNKMSEKEALDLIAKSIDAQRHKLCFIRSTLFFYAGGLVTVLVTAEFIIRQLTGIDTMLWTTFAGLLVGGVLLLVYRGRHKTVTAHDRTILNTWLYALGITLYTSVYTNMNDDISLPATGLLTMGAAIAVGVTSELFRRSEINRSNQSGSCVGLNVAALCGAFLAAWIFRAAATGEVVMQFVLTLAANVILLFGTATVLRYNESRNRV